MERSIVKRAFGDLSSQLHERRDAWWQGQGYWLLVPKKLPDDETAFPVLIV
jgi:hypothetical protein